MATEVFVYVIGTVTDGALGPPIKIGISANPQYRIATLQCANAKEIRIVKTFRFPSRAVASDVESCFHGTHADRQLCGEWFDVTPDEAIKIISIQTVFLIGAMTNLNDAEKQTAYEMIGIYGEPE